MYFSDGLRCCDHDKIDFCVVDILQKVSNTLNKRFSKIYNKRSLLDSLPTKLSND